MAGDAAGSSAHDGMMMREVPGDGASNSAADATFGLHGRADRKAARNRDHQSSMNETHRSLPELLGNVSNVRLAGRLRLNLQRA